MNKLLGHEIDFVFNYAVTKVVTLEGGYCTMLATDILASSGVKNVKNADRSANWAYLMISVRPEIVVKNIVGR